MPANSRSPMIGQSTNNSGANQTVYTTPLGGTVLQNEESQRIRNYRITELGGLLNTPIMCDRDQLKNRSIVVDILAVFFGIGTWIGINGTFIELPLLVTEAPEGWSLPSYLSVMVQIGNLGPIIYTLTQNLYKHKRGDVRVIYMILTVGTISSLLTAFFYNKTASIFGQQHSLALFVLTIFTAINACTSSVLFMPYMGRFKESYLVMYFIGEGLSGLIPSIVALIQGVGGSYECILVNGTTNTNDTNVYQKYTPPPRFSSAIFFIILFVMMLCSCVGFTFLDKLKLSRKQYAAVQVNNGNNYIYEREEKSHGEEHVATVPTQMASLQYWFLLILIAVLSFFANGIFNSIQSYSCLPYGANAYHLSATLSVIANPVACFIAMFFPHISCRAISMLFGIATILSVYVVVTAALSPYPPFYGTTIGAVIVIITWTLLIGLVSYTKLCITTLMRAQGGKSLFWTGCLTQLGSMFGSLIIFVLINFTNSFQALSDDNVC